MIACAQPTPGLTLMAPVTQFKAHAPHSRQASLSTSEARRSAMANTPRGQTSAHDPQPLHRVTSSCRVHELRSLFDAL